MNHGETTTIIHVLGDVAPSTVEESDPGMHDQIDAAYRTTYRRDGARSIDPLMATEARAATIKLVPRAIG